MNLYGDEIIFARELLQEMSNRGIQRFPFKTKEYYKALNQVREISEGERDRPTPLETLLVRTPFGEFPRMDIAIQSCLGDRVSISSHSYDEIRLNLQFSEVKYPLVKIFADRFIEKLNL